MKIAEQSVVILKLRSFGRAYITKVRERVLVYKAPFKDAGGKKDGREMLAAKFDIDKSDEDNYLFKGLRGTALCSAEDTYDELKGIQIAIDKLLKHYYKACKHQLRLDMLREVNHVEVAHSRFDSKIESLDKSIHHLATKGGKKNESTNGGA